MAARERLEDAVDRWGLRDVERAWVDTVWELDFTETEPLDPRTEGLITDDGVEAFVQLYKALSPFSADDHETMEMDDIFEEEDVQEEVYFSAHELLAIREALFLLLKNLLRLFSKISLKERPHQMGIDGMELSKTERSFPEDNRLKLQTFALYHETDPTKNFSFGYRTISRAKYVSELAYFGLRLLCSPLHSLGDKNLRQVFCQLLRVILMVPGKESGGVYLPIPSQIIDARKLALKFISSLTEELKEIAFPVLRILLQHICVKVPDKSEYRTYAALSLSQLLYKLPCAEHANFIAWLYGYSRNNKISYRIFALDVALALLEHPERVLEVVLTEEQQVFLKHKFLIQVMIFGRCSDKVPTVRSKALSSFAQSACSSVMDTNIPAETFLTNLEGRTSHQLKTFPTFKTIEMTHERDPTEFDVSTFSPYSIGKEIMAILRQRAIDEKTNVRKSALQVLTSILKHTVVPCTSEDLSTVQDRCRDPAISVRKLALQCITELLLSQPKNPLMQKAWLTGVVPVVMDCETSVQEKVLECVDQLLLQQIKPCQKFTHHDKNQALAWDLLTLLTKESQELRQPEANLETMVHILSVIGSVARHLPSSTQNRLMSEGLSAIETLQKLSQAITDAPKEMQELLNNLCGDLLVTCEQYISKTVLQELGTEQLQEDVLVRHLFTLGEIAQLCPAKVDQRIFLLIQSILASPDNMEELSSPAENEDLPASQPLSQFRGSMMPSTVRAHAFITLGKLCLQHEDLAKKCIAALARELEVSKDVAIRNNVVIVMCDLCVRYTTMVDRYIPDIAICLKDPEPFIRKQTLILLTNLLQEEFVKWKGCLFFRFVSVLVDPNPEIGREKTLFSLKGRANKEPRVQIYKFLLEHFTDEQRFNITSKISQNVLGTAGASEGSNPTITHILSCKEIKLSAMRSRPEEDIQPEEDELAMANAVMQVAQKKLISQVQKKNFIENVIPTITSLKTLLEQNKLPALRDLMNYLRIKEFFAMDKQLAAELEYDMKKYEEQLETEAEQGQELSVDDEGRNTLMARPPSTLERTAHPQNQMDEASPLTQSNSPPLQSPLSAHAMFTMPEPEATKARPSLNRPSSITNRSLEQIRAISTPELEEEPEASQGQIICLTSPDKLLPQPPQWRVNSPRRSSPSSIGLRRSSRRTSRQSTK
ncbi:hypothetical protein Chor_005636 [Crotalus horridus]